MTLRYKLRTLLILLAVLPPLLAGAWVVGSIVFKPRPDWQDIGGPGSIGPFTTTIRSEFNAGGDPEESNHEPAP